MARFGEDTDMTASSNPSPFGEVIDWFLTRVGDRRQYKRRPGAFHLWWQVAPDKLLPGIGTEISASGLVFIIQQPVTQTEFTIVCRIREKKIPMRVRAVRNDQVDHKGTKWHRYMCNFIGIAADNWDLVVRYVNDTPETPDRRKMQNQEMAPGVDDAYRLLPLAVQQKIIEKLVEQGKLEEPKAGQSPLLKLFYGGVQKLTNGSTMHRFNVHSRIKIKDDIMAYDTRFLIDEAGTVTIQK